MLISKNKIWPYSLIFIFGLICLTSLVIFKPIIDGDGLTYVESIGVLQGVMPMTDFVPNRLGANFLGLETIIFFSALFGSIESGWLVLNIIFCFIFILVFYRLAERLFDSRKTAFLIGLFLLTNYSFISFGFDYWLEAGGWAFYAIALYFTWDYFETNKTRSLFYAGLAIGVGGLFKEYAFLATIPIAVIIIYQFWPKVWSIVKRATPPAVLTLVPIIVVSFWVYWKFNYTYADWLAMNQNHYVYASRLLEYIKSLGSLFNALALLVFAGSVVWWCEGGKILPDKNKNIFIGATVLSVLPIFVWPAITQRILFITVPAALLIVGFCFKKYENYWWAFLPLWAVYAIINFTMDAFILTSINLPF